MNQQEFETDQTGQQGNSSDNAGEVNREFKGFVNSLRNFFGDLLDIRNNTDEENTKQSIIDDIPFKGHTAWILICSTMIASVGLNANSTAVVIGAMLISPLMGPILGMGLSVAINDIYTLRRSLKNFTVMVVLSILTAFLFFRFFPLQDTSSELLARTAPDIRDVLIAFSGGLALVIARAKKGTVASVIYGVAIATALMPPLCTVGFGLAIGNWDYAGGAMYLFTINTIFIGLATFVVLKILRFPMVRYANSQRRRRIAQLASVLAILVMIPAAITFYNVWQESVFKKEAQSFVNDHIKTFEFPEGGFFLDNYTRLDYNKGENPKIELVFLGTESIPEHVISTWENQLHANEHLATTTLVVRGGKDEDKDKFNYVTELYEAKKLELANKDERIKVLEQEIDRLRKFAYNDVPFEEISREIRINYENVKELGFANEIITNFKTTDTIPVFFVKWNAALSPELKSKRVDRLTEWLKLRTKNQKVRVREML